MKDPKREHKDTTHIVGTKELATPEGDTLQLREKNRLGRAITLTKDYLIRTLSEATQSSIPRKMKWFFMEVAGWNGVDVHHHTTTFPKKYEVPYKISPGILDLTTRKIASIIQSAHVITEYEKTVPKKWEIDALRLKSIALLEPLALCLKEKLALIHSSHCVWKEESLLEQFFVPFPGLGIFIKAVFDRDPLTPQHSTLLNISLETMAIPFYDPLHGTGFSFGTEALVAPFVPNKELFSPLQIKKEFDNRKRFFTTHREFFFSWMQSLLLSFLAAYRDDTQGTQKVVIALLEQLSKRTTGVEELIQLHQLLSYTQKTDLEHEEAVLSSATAALQEELYWKKRKYLFEMRKILKPTLYNIHEEKTALSDFEKKVFTVLLRHEIRFRQIGKIEPVFEEIETDFKEEIGIYEGWNSNQKETLLAKHCARVALKDLLE